MLTSKISYFNGIDTKVIKNISIQDFLEEIRTSQEFKTKIDYVRTFKKKPERDKVKMNLPSVCFSGTFENTRNDNTLLEYSGYVVIDIDIYNEKEITRIKNILRKDPYVVSFFISPSGGLKVLVYNPYGAENQSPHFYPYVIWYFNARYKIKLDSTSRNLSRLCFCSYDPDIYIAKEYKVMRMAVQYIEILKQEKIEMQKKRKYILDNCEVSSSVSNMMTVAEMWVKKKNTYIKGQRNIFIFKMAAILSEAGLDYNIALEAILYRFSIGKENFNNIQGTVKSAYKKTSGAFGTKPIYEFKNNSSQGKISF